MILAFAILLVWSLISRSLEPNQVLAARLDRDVAQSQVVAQSTENAYLRAQINHTSTPVRYGCPTYQATC